ncbi:hypothetical protein PENSUB_13420 [Penicillium subrubescens]|uniref:Uncharacterized protein n=1 Tax=Penicillium subrubescens TaxID=1316194 RepID=A0A1Q5SQL5_9EURO|nr:hypothetical protein PENSUB_13420 [Penicillium subrubescens]
MNSGGSALLWAAQREEEATARTCLSEGANRGVRDIDGGTAISSCVEWTRGRGEAVTYDYAVDVDSKDPDGRTPLWWATLGGHGALVSLLLETGLVDIDSKDSDG